MMMPLVQNVKNVTGAILGVIGIGAASVGAVSYFASLHQLKVARCHIEHAIAVLDADLIIKIKKDEITKIDEWNRELKALIADGKSPPNPESLFNNFVENRKNHIEAIKTAKKNREESQDYQVSGRCEDDPRW